MLTRSRRTRRCGLPPPSCHASEPSKRPPNNREQQATTGNNRHRKAEAVTKKQKRVQNLSTEHCKQMAGGMSCSDSHIFGSSGFQHLGCGNMWNRVRPLVHNVISSNLQSRTRWGKPFPADTIKSFDGSPQCQRYTSRKNEEAIDAFHCTCAVEPHPESPISANTSDFSATM